MFFAKKFILCASMRMNTFKRVGLGLAAAGLFLFLWTFSYRLPMGHPPEPIEGVALAIVYDTSGSMMDLVANAAGKSEPKFQIAGRALNSIFDQLDAYMAGAAPGTVREVQAEWLVLKTLRARRVIAMGPFQSAVFKESLASLPQPRGGTPLGRALQMAAGDLLKSPLSRKHVLVVTDGENTEGPAPEDVWPGILAKSERWGVNIHVHFVAFDVAAKVFDPVKNLGATVVGAGDEAQLKEQLEYILQKKILLENDDPPLK